MTVRYSDKCFLTTAPILFGFITVTGCLMYKTARIAYVCILCDVVDSHAKHRLVDFKVGGMHTTDRFQSAVILNHCMLSYIAVY